MPVAFTTWSTSGGARCEQTATAIKRKNVMRTVNALVVSIATPEMVNALPFRFVAATFVAVVPMPNCQF